MSRAELAGRQAELVAALVSGAPLPPGFHADDVAVARRALLRKRAGVAAHHWPLLAAGLEPQWTATFATWADARTPVGGLRDGWDLARRLHAAGELPVMAEAELAAREASARYDGRRAPRPRRLPLPRRVGGALAIRLAHRVVLRRLTARVHNGQMHEPRCLRGAFSRYVLRLVSGGRAGGGRRRAR